MKLVITLFFLLSILCFKPLVAQEATPASNTVRLAIVNTPVYSGLMSFLLEDFEQQTGFHVDVTNGRDVFTLAKSEKADIVIAHFGKENLDQFVLGGFGEWPYMVFSNQAAIIGPASDPANIRNLSDASLALKKIVMSQSKFIVNPQPGVDYLTDILWKKAGEPDKTNWIVEKDADPKIVTELADLQQAYFIWGAVPFLKFKNKHGSSLEMLVVNDPLLQRVMCSVIVNPEKWGNANYSGAKKLQDYLLSASTQAKITSFRMMGSTAQLWWPAGRDN